MSSKSHFNLADCFGEVVQTSVQSLMVQHWPNLASNQVANFGELIKFECDWGTVFGLVYDLQNLALFAQAKPIALQLSATELALQQPQFKDLMADFSWLKIIAYQPAGKTQIIFNYAPQPLALHTFAVKLNAQELDLLVSQPLFFVHALQAIVKVSDPERIVQAIILKLAATKSLTMDFFANFYQQYSRLPGFSQAQARVLFNQLQLLQPDLCLKS